MENFVNGGNSAVSMTPPIEDKTKQSRIAEALRTFNLYFGNVKERKFGYLWAKQGEEKKTYPFAVSSPDERVAMARKAIELNDGGFDVYFGVNLLDNAPDSKHRVKAEKVTLHIATITDIDVLGGTHIDNPDKNIFYPPNFELAKSLLPFETSIVVNSGNGLHSACLYSDPTPITDENRAAAKARNEKFISAIRQRAAKFSKAVDGVGDLPRVLRVPGTYNYKLGRDNAPLCHIVSVSEVRFTPSDMDARLDALTLAKKSTKQVQETPKSKVIQIYPNAKPSEQERALAMLRFIPVANQTYEDWVSVGMILKSNGNYCADWEQWSRNDERYHEGECESKWKGFSYNGGLTIATLHDFASKIYGYSEKAFQRDWYALHNNNPKIIHRPPDAKELSERLAALKAQPQSKSRDTEIIATVRNMCSWSYKKNESGQNVKSTIKSTVNNMKIIFDNDPNLNGLFGYDLFQSETIFLRQAPWRTEYCIGEQWTDADDAQLRTYLRENYAELKEKQLIEDYVIHYASKNAFNAVKDFLENMPSWDGIPRAENLFVKFLHAEDSDYTREVTMNWLFGAIARVYHPGCDYQTCLVLQGAQRIGKSRNVSMLGGKRGVNPNGQNWHVALKDSVDDAHAVDALQKGWIVEIEEFSAARRAEYNALKSFISAADDTRRFAYDRRATTRKRHVVFVVTCNDDQFLRDPTGNARFVIIKCSQKKFDRVEGMTPEYIRQVWAEVLVKYKELFKDGFDESKLQLKLETQIKAEEISENYLQDDGLTTEIKAFLDKKIPPLLIWHLLSKEERYRYRVDGGKIQIEQDDLDARFKNATGKRFNELKPQFDTACRAKDGVVRKFTDKNNKLQLVFYGSELREHICAAEIFNETLSKGDKRAAMYRINDILNNLEGWHVGKRLKRVDPEYQDQKKPYYRNR